MAKCEICGKAPRTGFNVSHSKRHTKRRWLPNVHRSKVIVNGKKRRLKICTRCLRSHYKLAH
ncbi:MAG: 50S ribosomal protein L28 [Chloroflexi bacterium]|nr:50S ribosomal protein L28 [Chloroflexota bacterium]